MLLTIKIWRALLHPPHTDPIFRQTSKRVVPPVYGWRRYLRWIGRGLFYLSILALSLLIIYSIIEAFLESASSGLSVVFVYLILSTIVLVITAQVNGVTWAARINNTMYDTRDRHVYDLLAVTLPGVTWMTWTISIGTIYRDATLRWLNRGALATVLGMIAALSVLLLPILDITFVSDINVGDPQAALEFWIVLVAAVMAFYIDVVQSCVLGFMLGMIASTVTVSQIENNIVTFGTFVLLQFFAYTVTVIVLLAGVPPLVRNLTDQDSVSAITLTALLSILVFYAAREAIIRLLWFILGRRLEGGQPMLKILI